jgi:UDP-GlcNAc:undecaprenyl-phosphate/decaprenyl-phosphate GlcNAc-1-phosphate transferase
VNKLEILLFCVAAGFLVSLVANGIILRVWSRRLELPSRVAEFHHWQTADETPVPRFGGVALAAAFAVLMCLPWGFLFGFRPNPQLWVIAGTALAMFGLGFWDDLRALGARRKLAGQVLIASAAYWLGLGIHLYKIPLSERTLDLGIYAWPVTVFWLVAMTNLINLIDGVDGLAGGIALMMMVLLSIVSHGIGFESPVAAGMAGALLAFLRFNFPPAKIYLGDGGAYFLGFLIGGLTIYNSQKGAVVAALIAPLFVLALPILDTTLAIARRALNGLPLFHADQRHLHHRLLQSGLSRQDVTLGAYAFTAYFLGLGLLAFLWRGQYLALALGGAMAAVVLLACRFHFSREWFKVGAVLGNSLKARAEINYALAHARCLEMEGERGGSLQSICEDTAMAARRLGFIGLRIQFENDEALWKMTDCPNWESCVKALKVMTEHSWTQAGSGDCCSYIFQHRLPGQPGCFIELQTPNLNPAATDPCHKTSPLARRGNLTPSKYKIVSELLAEAWAKSVNDWHRLHQQPLRFHPTAPGKAGTPSFGFAPVNATANVVQPAG